ncbi:MAG: LysR family transcriptional regulator, partial [Acidaminococcus fermentans]
MDNKDILLLKTLYEEKNITHTAKRLFLSQPALTDRLKRLEAEFGCTLFLRQPRGIQFTSEGELLYRFFLQMESSYQKIRDSLSDARIHPAGTLSIACSNVFAKYHMPRILTQFRKT